MAKQDEIIGRIFTHTLSKLLFLYIIIYSMKVLISVYGLLDSSMIYNWTFVIPLIAVAVIYNLYFVLLHKVKEFPNELLMLPFLGLLVPLVKLFLYVFVVIIGNRPALNGYKSAIIEVAIFLFIIIYSFERLDKNLRMPIEESRYSNRMGRTMGKRKKTQHI